ncbi:MAG: hypothetical protein ACI9GH_000123 [Candidatus Paceibacteria bacterium]|jgi:hypothetical protein
MPNERQERNIDDSHYLELLNTDYFKDTQFLFILKKTEKIVSAIYLVTDQLSDEENIKKTIRKSVTELLMDITLLGQLKSSKKNYKVPVSLYKTITLLDSAHLVGLINKSNFNVLRTEMTKLLKEIGVHGDDSSDTLVYLKDRVMTGKSSVKDINTDKRHSDTSVLYKKDTKTKSDRAEVQNSRKDMIADLVRNMKIVSVKDVSFKFQNYSEKTLQRDLLQLVKEGILKKEGERRWSKYSLV